MKIPKKEGFKYRLVASTPGRILEVIRAGWHVVLDNNGKCIQQIIGKNWDGSPKWGYLVEISAEAYQARQEAKSRRVGYIVENLLNISGNGMLTARDLEIDERSIGRHHNKYGNSCQYPD